MLRISQRKTKYILAFPSERYFDEINMDRPELFKCLSRY